MKHRFFLLLTSLALSFLTYAQEGQPIAINAGDIEHLTLVDDMDIVLLQGKSDGKGISSTKMLLKK